MTQKLMFILIHFSYSYSETHEKSKERQGRIQFYSEFLIITASRILTNVNLFKIPLVM